MTAIADNAGTAYNFTMPSCKANETFSNRLYNVRNARTPALALGQCQPRHAHRQQSGGLGEPLGNNASYNYYSDTRLSGGVPVHQFENNGRSSRR